MTVKRTAYAAIRIYGDKEGIDVGSISRFRKRASEKAFEFSKNYSIWAVKHPVQRVVKIELKEIK